MKTNNTIYATVAIVEQAEKFLNTKKGTPVNFVKGALRAGFVNKAELADLLNVGPAQLLKSCAVNNRDVREVVKAIVTKGKAQIAAATPALKV
jgi:hypothetical protein